MNTLTTSAEIDKLASAIVAAQADLRNPPKDSVNPHFKSRFADLATVRETVLPALNKHKLAVVQLPCEVEGVGPGLCTMLLHESGQFVRAVVSLRPAKTDPQGIGAAMTYARRYGLQAVLGVVADDDDDGNQASRPPQQKQQQQSARQQSQPPPAGKRERVTDDQLRKLLQLKGWKWLAVVDAVNAAERTSYPADALPKDIDPDHLGKFCDWLAGQPNKAAPQPA